jgi:dehydrogenase/reductase SDR family protein 7
MGYFYTVFLVAVAVYIKLFLLTDCDPALQVLPYSSLDKSFTNKVIWITGASSGIGASLAQELTAGGAKTILSARRIDQLEDVANKCALLGERPFVVPFDMTDFDEHDKAFNLIIEKFGRIDVLVLNAGRSQRALAMDTDIKDTKALMDLNFLSFVSLAKLVVPTMTSSESGGQVVVVSSLTGRIGTPIASSYSASKHALHGYFDALRGEVNFKGVNIQIVCPGPVESEIALTAIRSSKTEVTPDEKKMPTERCTFLMAKGMKWKLDETWISNQPFLAIMYITTYLPFTFRQLNKYVIGPSRVKTLEVGGDVYSMKNFFGGGK